MSVDGRRHHEQGGEAASRARMGGAEAASWARMGGGISDEDGRRRRERGGEATSRTTRGSTARPDDLWISFSWKMTGIGSRNLVTRASKHWGNPHGGALPVGFGPMEKKVTPGGFRVSKVALRILINTEGRHISVWY